MKPSEIIAEIESIFSQLSARSNFGAFGLIEVKRTKRVNIKSIIPAANKKPLWEPDDFKPLFQIRHCMDNDLFQNPLCFSIGRKEVWISTWYLAGLGSAENILRHPFVMSWNKFLEVNNLENDGLEFVSTEKGLQILKLWVEWVLKYS